jgi:hypothetical protein
MSEQNQDKYLVDFDDYSTEHNILDKLKELKQILPNFKVNLFTIPHKISHRLLQDTKKENDWIQMIPHGFFHDDNYECAKLTMEEFDRKLRNIPYLDLYIRGFKAPGWQINLQVMEVLKKWGWWVAVQWSDGRFNGDPNGPFQPAVIHGLKYYAFREYPNAIHGHAWECMGNGLETLWQQLINLPKSSEFEFIDNYIYGNN